MIFQRIKLPLESNGKQGKICLKLKVKTCDIQLNCFLPPYRLSLSYFISIFFIFWTRLLIDDNLFNLLLIISIWATVGAMIGAIIGCFFADLKNQRFIAISIKKGSLQGIILGMFWLNNMYEYINIIIFSIILWKIDFKHLIKKNFYNKGFREKIVNFYILLTTATSILTGIGAVIGFNSYLLAGLTVSALPLAGMLIYPPIKRMQLKAQYRRQESQNLIEP